MMVSFRLQHY